MTLEQLIQPLLDSTDAEIVATLNAKTIPNKIIEPKQEDNFIPGLIIGGIVGACL